MMRKWVVMLVLATAACSKPVPDQGTGQSMHDDAPPPDIHATLAPGIALTYAYTFRLPLAQVAGTQEKHAMQCEALGVARCRIAGMTYHVVQSRAVEASLELKLAPELARGFAKKGIATVTEDGGMLSDAVIASTEAGATIAAAARDQASVAGEQKDLAGQLAQSNLSDDERTQLQSRQADLRNAQRTLAATRADATALLASTPVTFTYSSGVIDTGFRDGPFLGAVKDGWANLVGGALAIVTLLITFSPWIALALLLVWLWKRYARRLGMGSRDDE